MAAKALCLSFALLGCSAARAETGPTPPQAVAGSTFRLATYNVNFGNGDDPRTLAALAALDADVVLLQETTPRIEAAVRATLGPEYAHLRFAHCCRAGGLGIASRYPIVNDRYLEEGVGFFPAWWYELDTPRGSIVVLNVHLRPPMSDGGSWVVGFFSTRDDREREMEAFLATVPREHPLVVAGDFNESERGRAVAVLERAGLRNAFSSRDARPITWMWTLRGGARLRGWLDHVMVSKALDLRTARVLRAGVSDHFPVVVELGWRD